MENAVATNTATTENLAPATESTTEGQQEFSINEPEDNYDVDEKGMLQRIVANAQKENPTSPQLKGKGEKTTPTKRTLTVDKQALALSEEERDRWAQKGIANEKRWVEIAREKKQIQKTVDEVNKTKKDLNALIAQFEEHPMELMLRRHGKEKTRAFVEPFLAQEIKEEMLPEHERRLREKDAEIERLKAERSGDLGQKEEIAHQGQVQVEIEKANQVIIKALNEVGIPRTDFTAAEMADYMLKAISNKIEYTPEKLASVVREDNILRVAALTEQYSNYAQKCYKENNTQGVIAAGEAMEDLLGAQVVKTLRYLDLARLKAGQPMVPQQILETPRAKAEETKPRYMSEDAYAAERKRRAQAIDRGEAVSDW